MVWPILISLSDAPGSYFFCADTGPAASAATMTPARSIDANLILDIIPSSHSRFTFLILPSADRPAAVDDEFGAGDIAALVAGEPEDAVGDFFGGGLVAERDGAFGELVQRRPARRSGIRSFLGRADQRVPDGGFGDAGVQRVDAHAILCGGAFQRDRFRKQPHAA